MPILMAAAMVAITGEAFAGNGPNTVVPFIDDFEAYTNGTALNTGTNGWYGSSNAVVVQTNVVRSGTNAAIIPYDCALSNRFQNIARTNVWIQMDLRPRLYSGANNPEVDTNLAGVFYINSNGNFVVHNGPTTNAVNSTNWVVVNNVTIATNETTWVRINIYENFAQTNWDLYADGVLVTNHIGFVNTSLTNFTGFDIYNGATTSYLDNVSVTAPSTNAQPPLIVVPSELSQRLYVDSTVSVPDDQTVRVVNVWSSGIGFRVAANQSWITNISVSPAGWIVAAAGVATVKLSYASTAGWPPGVSNATVSVVATNGIGGEWGTQTVHVALNMISSLFVATPAQFSNSVWKGATPANRTLEVRNQSEQDLSYTVETNAFWIASLPSMGTLPAFAVTNLTLTNTVSTLTWGAGTTSNATVTVRVTNTTSGIFAEQIVPVFVNVQDISNVLAVMPTSLTNIAWTGDAPSNQTFIVSNRSDAGFVYSATNAGIWSWITNISPTGGTLAAHAASIVTLMYDKTTNWQAPGSSTFARVSTSNGNGATQDVIVTVNIKDFTAGTLQVTPTTIINSVLIGDTPTSQTFQVSNTGDFSFVYGVSTTNSWISASPTGGTLVAHGTNTVTLTYGATWGWTVGQSNSTVIVSSANGIGATQSVAVILNVDSPAANYYVATDGNNVSPFTNWSDAARTLTAAVHVASFFTNVASVVWVSNGVYDLSGELTLSNVMVRSLNGAESVILNGGNFRGFKLAHTGAVLNGLTITNCFAGNGTNGGAVFVSTGLVENCRLMRNSATYGGGVALGAGGVVRNCLIWGNTATNGGGVFYDMADTISGARGIVESCTVASNYAVQFGGGLYTRMNMTGLCVNAVIYQNTAGGAYSNWGTNINAVMVFSNSCMAPTSGAFGANNTADAPLFVNVSNGNCRLIRGSPCINTGTNKTWMTNDVDLDGNTRIINGRVDMGAYENPLSWVVIPGALTNQVMVGLIPADQFIVISNQSEAVLNFTVTNADWLADTATNGYLAAHSNATIIVKYSSLITNWTGGVSNTTVMLVVTNSLSSLYPAQTGAVAVTLNVMELKVAPADLAMTNNFMYSNSLAIPSQIFSVWNAGGATFNYTIQPQGDSTNWLSLSASNGVAGSNTVTVQYANGMLPGNYAETLVVASSNGGGATSYVNIAVQVLAQPILTLNPLVVTQTVGRGANPVNQAFLIQNASTSPQAPMAYALTVSNGSPDLIKNLVPVSGLNTGQSSSVTINYIDISDAAAGAVYTAVVQVVAWDAGTTYSPTGTVQLSTTLVVRVNVTALPPPSGVTASAGTYTDHVVVSWDPVPQAVAYNVYRSSTFVPTSAEPIGEAVGTSFDDLTALAGVRYYYWVTSVNASRGEGTMSTNMATGYRGLLPPGGVFATDGAFTNKVRVTWPLVDGATAYQLYRDLVPIYFASNGVYEDVSVTPGVHYAYAVAATNGIFGSALSDSDSGYAFGVPGGLTASKGTYAGKVRVTWTAVELAAEYEVWRSARALLPPNGAAVKLATVTAPGFDDTSVAPGVTYYYWARARGLEAGIGGWSEMDSGYGALGGVDLWVRDLVVLPVQVGVGGSPVVASFRMGNGGGTNMAGANGTVGMEFFASTNQVFGAGGEISIGKVVTAVTLGIGADMVMKVAGNQLTMPATEGDYNIFVRVLPEFPSLLADTNPNDNVVTRNGRLRVRSSGGLNYQVFNDYDGDGISDLGVYRGMEWNIRSVDGYVLVSGVKLFGGTGRPVLGDLDGDRRADPIVHDSASGIWQVLYSGSGYTLASGVFGVPGYRGLVADYEGLGHGDASVFHEENGRWYVLRSDGGLTVWNWGAAGYEPVIGDYDGDGHWDLAVYQEATGLWFIRRLDEQLLVSGATFGGPGCSPVAGDYDGDGRWDAAIYVRSTGKWYIASLDARILGWGIEWGGLGFEPVMGDYDGDGKWDLGVYQESTGLWYIRTLDGTVLAWASHWGGAGYRPIGN